LEARFRAIPDEIGAKRRLGPETSAAFFARGALPVRRPAGEGRSPLSPSPKRRTRPSDFGSQRGIGAADAGRLGIGAIAFLAL
jgi:hypothetical protein